MNLLRPLFLLLALAPMMALAQRPQTISPAIATQMIMQPQPPVDNSRLDNLTVTATFDPPAVRPGEKVFYRVSVSAMGDQIVWPQAIAAPAELHLGPLVRGQLTLPDGTPFRPLTEFLYEVTPVAAGHFVITNFAIMVRGQSVDVPAASLEVGAYAAPPPRKLSLEILETNLFYGQPFRVRVILPAIQGAIEALRDVQLTGGDVLPDEFATHQMVETANIAGQLSTATICEMKATSLGTGPLSISAQAFTAGAQFNGVAIHAPATIRGGPPNYQLVVSDPVKISVRPLPPGELPGFNGSMGRFFFDPPHLRTNRLHVGEPVQLTVTFHGEGELTHLVPPMTPRSRDWQIIADPPPATSFTFIPLTDEATSTPAIPFASFDPASGKYVDLTIPAQPVTVVGEGLPLAARVNEYDTNTAPLKLSGLAATPGSTAPSLTPPQLRYGLVTFQIIPLLVLAALWRWDRHRRFLEAHPDLVRRRRARRGLRRQQRLLQTAAAGRDAEAFLRHAVAALQVACAPHYPAQPRALVCADVLAQLPDAPPAECATVRRLFAAADAQFAARPTDRADWHTFNPQLQVVLQRLEAKL